MKKILLRVVTIAIFLLGMNNIKAALVEGDDVYHFDFTMNHKVINNYYDSVAPKCLMNYARNINHDYTESWTHALDGSAYVTIAHNSKNLFVWAYDYGYLDIIDATGDDNYVADISQLDEDDCPLTHFGYNKIAVYFAKEESDEIPVRTDYTIDLTNNTYDNLNAVEKAIILQLLFYENDDILPDIHSDTDIDGFPFFMTKNGKQVLKFDIDSGDWVITIPNPEELTTDDNITLTKSFLQNASLTPYGDVDLNNDLASVFDTVNIIVSHNNPATDPTTPDEDSTEPTNELEDMNNTEEDSTKPDIESEDSSEKEDINPTSETDITPKSGDTKSPIISPATGDNVILYLIMFLGSTTGIVVNYWLGKQKN